MAEDKFGNYYGEAEVKGFKDAQTARDKLDAKAAGEEWVAPQPEKAEVVADDRPAADAPTIAETQKKAAPAKK